MKTTLPLLLLVLTAFAGCRATDSDAMEFECICGTPEGAIETCLHPICLEGERNNPDNPDCACGHLSMDD